MKKLFQKLFKPAGAELSATGNTLPAAEHVADDPIKPGKVDLKKLRFILSIRGVFRKRLRRRYKRRPMPTIFVNGGAQRVPFWKARRHFLHTNMREANEIRRFTRERQLEARALRAQAAA